MNNTRGKAVFSLVAVVALLFAFGLGALSSYELAPRSAASQPSEDNSSAPSAASAVTPGAGSVLPVVTPAQDLNAQMKEFYSALDLVKRESYYGPVDQQKLVYGAIEGMMHAVGDDYTRFETPSENQVTQTRMKGDEQYGGIGAYVEVVNDVPVIFAPIPGTPAARSGLRPRDIILRVDGRDVTTLSAAAVAELIKGPEGSKVRLTLQRGTAAPFDLEITRAIINIPQVSSEIRPDGVALITAAIFGDKTTEQLDAGLKDAQAQHAKGIILDLRNNGGGYVAQAQEMLGRFVSPEMGKKYGDVALYYSYAKDGSNDKAQPIMREQGAPTAYDLPLVVLMNSGTASASEITAAALSDYGRATLIGEQSFGKGSVQNVHDLPDGASARITIAHWLSPAKRDINPRPTPTAVPSATASPLPTLTPTPIATLPPSGTVVVPTSTPVPELLDRGLTPDIEVRRTDDDYAKGRDPQLDRAVQFILNGK
jgi:carboxyl-terminal processing protease